MSLAIDINAVTAVLLADGWHQVAERSFALDAYEYVDSDVDVDHPAHLVHGGGRAGVCSTGFAFVEDLDDNAGLAYRGENVVVAGPLTAILAVTTVPAPA